MKIIYSAVTVRRDLLERIKEQAHREETSAAALVSRVMVSYLETLEPLETSVSSTERLVIELQQAVLELSRRVEEQGGRCVE